MGDVGVYGIPFPVASGVTPSTSVSVADGSLYIEYYRAVQLVAAQRVFQCGGEGVRDTGAGFVVESAVSAASEAWIRCGRFASECGCGGARKNAAAAADDGVERAQRGLVGSSSDAYERLPIASGGKSVGDENRGSHGCSVGLDGRASGVENTGDARLLVSDQDCPVSVSKEGEPLLARGRHYVKNKHRRERERCRKAAVWQRAKSWRRFDGSGGCVSDESSSVAGTACTVDTRTGVELEAAQTLAARRVVENQLAIAQGKARLASFDDKSKTEALARLSVARMEQRINEAKAKSQASYKKCDESLKSLGSSGSAGEYALKQQVKDAHQDRALLKYVEAQAALLARDASPETLAAVARLPPPVFESEHEVFGECPNDYNEDEQFAYYRDLDRREFEQNEKCLSFSPFQ